MLVTFCHLPTSSVGRMRHWVSLFPSRRFAIRKVSRRNRRSLFLSASTYNSTSLLEEEVILFFRFLKLECHEYRAANAISRVDIFQFNFILTCHNVISNDIIPNLTRPTTGRFKIPVIIQARLSCSFRFGCIISRNG